MKLLKVFSLLVFVLSLRFNAAAQSADGKSQIDFYLLPLLEAAFSGDLPWRPDWPTDFPPDGFSLPAGKMSPLSLALSDGEDFFYFKRNSAGRLEEFPFFLPNGYLKVKAAYTASGALRTMNVSVVSANEVSAETANLAAAETAAPAAEVIWNMDFPVDFFSYSDSSPGVFQPVRINRDDAVFFVFIFESPAFLTETWYDGEGNLLAFCKALVNRENMPLFSLHQPWRIRSLQTQDASGLYNEDYFFGSDGNISEIRSTAGIFSALYRDGRPCYWQQPDFSCDLQWDTQGFLTGKKTENQEFRYEHEPDASGNWVKLREIAIINQFGVFAPQPPVKTWSRWISLESD
jgi:hypothetical protein